MVLSSVETLPMAQPPNRMVISTWPDERRENVVIQIEQDGSALAHILLDSASIEKHIHDLAKHRATLTEEVPHDLDVGARIEAVVDPVWRIPGEHPEGMKVLILRHQGMGWLGFAIPHKEARAIAEWLLKDLPPETPDKT